MTLVPLLVVSFGAGIGAVLRYLISQWFAKKVQSNFPWATWLINLSGTLLFGFCIQRFPNTINTNLWGVWLTSGVCGGFTTFSTMVQETVHLLHRQRLLGTLYITTSLGLGLVLSFLIQLLVR